MSQEFQHGAPTRVNKHITSSATTAVTAVDALLHSVNVTTTTAGTTWVIKVQDKSGTPLVAYTNSSTGVAVGTDSKSFPQGLQMNGGIDIVTAGTAGVLDVFLAYS
jgi:hypothetical protein